MDALLFAVKAVSPILLMMVTGYCLRELGLMNDDFTRTANRLIFRVFIPAMLYLNIYKIDDVGDIDGGFLLYAAGAILVITLLVALPVTLLTTHENTRRGVILQAAARSNTALVGLPLAEALFGQAGVAALSLQSAVTIPLCNVLAILSLSVFGGEKRPDLRRILKTVFGNPLILSVGAALLTLGIRRLFVLSGVTLRLTDLGPVFTFLTYLSNLATPLSLLVLGAQFRFSAVASLKREILVGVLLRTAAAPLLGLGIAYLFFSTRFSGAQFASFVALFATPVAASSVPMVQELNGDVTLAGQLAVWTTVASAFSIFIAAFLLRAAGIF
jgi:predicted permease